MMGAITPELSKRLHYHLYDLIDISAVTNIVIVITIVPANWVID